MTTRAYATAPDLDRFLRAARTGKLFSARLTQEFLWPHALHWTTQTRTSRYGLGLEFVSDPDDRPRFLQKDGLNAGASGLLRYYPDTDLTVVLLSNTARGVWQPARDVDAMVRARRPPQPVVRRQPVDVCLS